MAQEKNRSTDNMTFLSSANAEYIAHLYGEFLQNPFHVDESWKSFFEGLNDNEVTLLSELNGASWTPEENKQSSRSFDNMAKGAHIGINTPDVDISATRPQDANPEALQQATRDSIQALMLIRAYRARGHFLADLDPLELRETHYHPELDPAHYDFQSEDYNRPIFINGVLGKDYATLTEILKILKDTYCNSIGVEFLHLTDPEEKAWMQARIEGARNQSAFKQDEKKFILQRMIAAEVFEQFLHKKYPGTKRFGVDGGEAVIPAIEEIMRHGAGLGLREVVIGMAHRGRLNVLANVMGKSFTAIFAEFQGQSSMPDDVQGSGDVKYHLGTSSDREFDGNERHLSLTANPSHLEFVNPVVIGKVRAKQSQARGYRVRFRIADVATW